MSIHPEDPALKWIRFVRQYGPIASNKSAYEEHIHKSAKRNGVEPIFFTHPYEQRLLESFQTSAEEQRSVILTGTAGDGKTHLCHQLWRTLGDDNDSWGSETYVHRVLPNGVTLHVVKDLTAWSPPAGEKEAFLEALSTSLFSGPGKDCYLIAVNDGQLIESWRRLPDTPSVIKARALFEELLVKDEQSANEVRLWFYNLSRSSSAELLDQALPAFLKHEGWQRCFEGKGGQRPSYGAFSPIRRNYELLSGDLVQKRLRQLFELCDYNELHIPIREILTLLANAVLGHPKCGDALMLPIDVETNIKSRSAGEAEKYNRWLAEASIYSNLLGGNLRSARRETIGVFNYLDRFRIGHETTNRIDNMLIFGDADEELRDYFDRFLAEDSFYGAGEAYLSAQKYYIEGADESEEKNTTFLKMLIAQRRALFFKILDSESEELHLWDLTVFRYAGEYLSKVIRVLNPKSKVLPTRVEKGILGRLVRGLNRVFVGMLVTSEHELYLGTSLRSTSAKVSRILEESISVTPKLGERVEIIWHRNGPALRVTLSDEISRVFALNLVRYEFLSRVATGALPSSFSKECYEDVLSFKSQVLAALDERRALEVEEDSSVITFRPLVLDDNGVPKMGEIIEVSTLTAGIAE